MLPNINLEFLTSVENNILYSRDSILNDYTKIVERIQSIKFIKEYLIQNKNSKLNIFYFNNRSMTDYSIDNINKKPSDWENYDRTLKYYSNSDSENNKKALNISERVNCGCNYRFEKTFIEKGIYFDFYDKDNNSTTWVLLPDNKLLLYIMDSKKIMNLNIVKEEFGINNPCLLFDFDGNQINK
jgi:hypothetical protein